MKSPFSTAFGQVVRRHREKAGLSQEDWRACWRAPHLRQFDQLGKVRLGLDAARRVADGLDQSLSKLVGEAERQLGARRGRQAT